MKPIGRIAAALALAALVIGAPVSAIAGGRSGQDDPFEKLKSYDFQSRAPVAAINQMIQQALGDKDATAQIESHLIAVLEDPATTFAGKQEACRMLWIVGTSSSVPTLEKMLADEKLADMARYALERNTDPSAAKALRDALPTAQGKTLIGIINSLGDRRDAEAAPALKPFTTDSDPLVSGAAIAALGKIGTVKALDVLRAVPDRSVPVYKALLRCADRLAAEGNKRDATHIYEGLAGAGRPDLVRAEALRGLAAMPSPRTAAVAVTCLKASEPYVQEVAAHICGSLPDSQTTARCIAAWPSLPTSTQTILLTAWSDRRASAALPLALSAIASQDASLRLAGIQAGARIGGAKAVPRLVAVLMHGDGADQDAARAGLASLTGPEAEQALLQTARQGQPEERAALMGVLAERPTPGAMAALLEAARGSDTHLAIQAIQALGRVGGAAERGELLKLLVTTPSDDVRDAAKEAAIGITQRWGDRGSAADAALAALPDAPPAGKGALLGILAEIGGDRALAVLTQAVNSDQPEIKQAAVAALADTWSDSRPLPMLLAVAKSDSNKVLRVQALRGYLRLVGQDEKMPAEEKVQRIRAALDVAQRQVEKTQALGVLRDCRIESAMTLAAGMLDDPSLFDTAADTVLYLAAPQKKGNTEQPAVKGAATKAALQKVIRLTKSDDQRAQAQQLAGQ